MMQSIRIGSRESDLALYQAYQVEQSLKKLGLESEIIKISSEGDSDLVTPLYEMGIQGIFTKSLDKALLANRIDIAVHSAKDIPTKLASGLSIAAFPERGPAGDTLVKKSDVDVNYNKTIDIATGSLRRKMQWLYRYPNHHIHNIRGNIQTRLAKLQAENWQGTIVASAALTRLNIDSSHFESLDWMLPSPAQGAIAVVCREGDNQMKEICQNLNHEETSVCIKAERQFLSELQGGCAVPIAAYSEIREGKLLFKGNIISLDARRKVEVESEFDPEDKKAGQTAAHEIIAKGGEDIVKTFRKT